MKTKILSLASLTFASSLSFGATSCLTGNKTIEASQTLTSRNYVVSPFTGVDCSSVVDIKIRQGSSQSVVLEAPTNYIDYFIVSVKNGILHVDSKSGVNFRNTNDIEMTIVVPELKMVKTSGTGDFNAKTSGSSLSRASRRETSMRKPPEPEILKPNSSGLHLLTLRVPEPATSASPRHRISTLCTLRPQVQAT